MEPGRIHGSFRSLQLPDLADQDISDTFEGENPKRLQNHIVVQGFMSGFLVSEEALHHRPRRSMEPLMQELFQVFIPSVSG